MATHFKGAVDSQNGFTVNGTVVIDENGKIIESAGIEIADGDAFLDTNGNEVLGFNINASAVNNIGIENSATGVNPIIKAQGEADTGITFENDQSEEILILDAVATAVNEITIANAATGNNPTVACTGEVNTGITFQNSEAEEILILDSVATSVNELTIRSAATGTKPIIAATGEADNGMEFHNDQAEEILILQSAATSVNELTITSAAAGSEPSIAATGDDTDIDIDLIPKGAGNVSINGGQGLASSVANGFAPFYKALVKDNIAAGAGGAIAITNFYTTINTDGGGDAFTLADGDIIGQLKRIQLITDGGGDAVITPANFVDGTTITMADAGDYTLILWNGTGWTTVEDGNTVDGVSAPVIA